MTTCLGLRGRQVDEDESAPDGHADAMERELRLVEIVCRLKPGGNAELAFELVAPGVVGAPNGPGKGSRPRQLRGVDQRLLFEYQAASSMTAYVVVADQLTGGRAGHQDTLSGHLQNQVVSRLGEGLLSPGAEPFPIEDPLSFERVNLLRQVVGAGQATLEPEPSRLILALVSHITSPCGNDPDPFTHPAERLNFSFGRSLGLGLPTR